MKQHREINIKKIASLAGTILMIASLFFISMRFVDMWGDLDLGVLASPWVLIPLLLVVFGESVTVILASVNYRNLVADISGIVVNRPFAIKVYNNANMYKYIPGGVMYVIGRNQMAIETDGLSHRKVALATLLEGVLWVVAAIILSSIFALEYSLSYISQLEFHFVGLISGVIVLIVILTLYRFRHHFLKNKLKTKNKAKNFQMATLVKRLPFMLVIVSLWGGSFLATMTILGQPITFNSGISIVGLYIMSWVIGFLTPGAPSGLGIREVVLLMFLSGIVYEEILLSTIVIHRVLQVAGDIVAFGIACSYAYLKR